MSNLTGQQINQTYPGLLNLQTATSGVTSSLQQIQDGLGNNTGAKIATNQFYQQNTIPPLNINYTPDYMGPGFNITGVATANIQNRILYSIFYDPGLHAYSAITYYIQSATSTSDVYEWAFYDLQWVPSYGIAPKSVIQSGITLTVNSIGLKTTTLPSTLSFSGTGGGYYVIAYYVTNGGETTTVRYTNGNFNNNNQSYAFHLGLYLNAAGTGTAVGQKYGTLGSTINVLNLPFQSSYSQSDITTNYVTTIVTQPSWGVGLNTI